MHPRILADNITWYHIGRHCNHGECKLEQIFTMESIKSSSWSQNRDSRETYPLSRTNLNGKRSSPATNILPNITTRLSNADFTGQDSFMFQTPAWTEYVDPIQGQLDCHTTSEERRDANLCNMPCCARGQSYFSSHMDVLGEKTSEYCRLSLTMPSIGGSMILFDKH